METRPLHRSAGDRVHLVDGQLRDLVVFKDHLFLIPCIQGDGLLPVRVPCPADNKGPGQTAL